MIIYETIIRLVDRYILQKRVEAKYVNVPGNSQEKKETGVKDVGIGTDVKFSLGNTNIYIISFSKAIFLALLSDALCNMLSIVPVLSYNNFHLHCRGISITKPFVPFIRNIYDARKHIYIYNPFLYFPSIFICVPKEDSILFRCNKPDFDTAEFIQIQMDVGGVLLHELCFSEGHRLS